MYNNFSYLSIKKELATFIYSSILKVVPNSNDTTRNTIGNIFSSRMSKMSDAELGTVRPQFDEFRAWFNEAGLSADAAAEKINGVNQSIVEYAKTCKNGELTWKGFVNSQKSVAASTKALNIGVSLLNSAISIGIGLAISFAVEGISRMIKASEEMSAQAKEATSKFKEESTAIEDNKKKIIELRNALTDSNISYTDARDKRSQLLDIQKQLIDSYGEEVKGINLVNGSLDEQINKLDEVNSKKRQDWENDVNKLTPGQQLQKWAPFAIQIINGMLGSEGFNFLPAIIGSKNAKKWLDDFDETTNVERIQNKIENFRKSIRSGKFKDVGDDLRAQLESYNGVSFDGNKMTISGDTKTVQETISQIQRDVIGSREDLQWLKQDLKDVYNSAKKITDENWDTYNTAMQYQIIDDEAGAEYYAKLTEAFDDYQEALKSGSEDGVKKATSEYADILDEIAKSDLPDNFKKYFEGMYPDLAETVRKWKFEVQIKPKILLNIRGVKSDIDAVSDLTTDEIESIFNSNGNGNGVTAEQRKAIFALNEEAQANGLTLKELLEQLRQAGYLSSQIDRNIDDIVNKYAQKFGVSSDTIKQFFEENSIDTEEEADKWIEIADAYNTADKAFSHYKHSLESFNIETLTKEIDDLQSAYKTMQEAVKEYNSEGYISVDTYQSLLSLGDDYLRHLFDEEGNLRIDEQAIKDVTIARINELAVKQKSDLLNMAEAWESEADAQEDLKIAIDNTTASYEDQFQVQLKKLKAKWLADDNWTPEGVEDALNYINKEFAGIDRLTNSVIEGIQNGAGMTGESASNTQKQLSDLAKSEALDRIKYKFDSIEASVEKLTNSLSLLDNAIDLLPENDYLGRIQGTSLQLDIVRQKAGLLADEFTQLQNTQYDNADAANELATRMKSTADAIMENQKSIMEYGKSIVQYHMDALTSVNSLSKDTLDEATELIDRNIKALSDGGLIGLDFTLTPNVPQSAVEKQRQENETMLAQMKAYYDAVAQMQKTALDMQFQETMAEHAKQRQELQDNGEQKKNIIGSHNADVEKSTKDTNQKTTDDLKKSDDEKEQETKEFVRNEEMQITNLNTWLKDNPITAPKLDNTSWDNLLKQTESYINRVKELARGEDVPDLAATLNTSSRSKAVQAATKYLGVPYKWGGTSADGVDCSGLTLLAMKEAGVDIPRVADDQWHDTKGAVVRDMKDLKYGDLVFFDTDGNKSVADHVGMYVGEGTMIHAPHTGDVVKYQKILGNDYYESHFLGARRYYTGTGKFGYNGIAGETYEAEYLRDKRTGEFTRVTSPTPIDTRKTDVIGVEETKRLEKNKFARGTRPVPKGLGKYYTYMNWDTVTNMDTQQGRLIKAVGKNYDSEGYGKIGDRYALAMTSTFGSIGDAVDIQLNDGSIIHGVIADEKSQTYTAWDHNPANQWGHDNGQNVVEFVTNWAGGHSNPFGGKGSGVASVTNLGSVFDDTQLAQNVSTIADNTQPLDFMAKLKAVLNDGVKIDGEFRSTTEDDLIAHITKNIGKQEDISEQLLSSWEKMQGFSEKSKSDFQNLRQQLLDSVGTDDFVKVRQTLSDATTNYALTMMKESTAITAQSIKAEFDRAEKARQLTLDYYNTKKAEGANADVLKVIQESYDEQTQYTRELSDKYVSAIDQYTQYVVQVATSTMQSFDNRQSWIDRDRERLEHDLNNTDSVSERAELIKALKDNAQQTIALKTAQQKAAHAGVLELRADPQYAELLKEFDVEAWYDANGEETVQYALDRQRLTADGRSDLVPIMKTLFEGIQVYKKSYWNSVDAIQSATDSIKEFDNEFAKNKVEQYTKNLERLNEIDNQRKERQDAITSAMEKQHSISQSLRQEIADINAELAANRDNEQWLDKDTRDLLFNEEDYAEEMRAINKIQSKANSLYQNYQNSIANLSETEWYQEAQITDEYNKQMDILNEQLETEKQRIALKKKEIEYNNALRERDTRIIMNGRAVMVANPETMYNLEKERSLAKSELSNTILANRETEQERNSDRVSQALNQEILARDKMIDFLGKMSDAEIQAYAAMLPVIEELELFGEAMSNIDISWMNTYSRSYRDQYANLPEIYKMSGYDIGYNYAGGYEVATDLRKSGVIKDEVSDALLETLEGKHNWKSQTDISNSQYAQTSDYGGKQFSENYGDDDEKKFENFLSPLVEGVAEPVRDFMAEMQSIINSPNFVNTPEQLSRLKELETLRNKKLFEQGDYAAQTNDWGANKFLKGYTITNNVPLPLFQTLMGAKIDPLALKPNEGAMLQQMFGDMLKAGNANIKNITQPTNETIYNINGDNYFTQKVDDADDFMASFTQKVSQQYDVTKNMK